jgi:F-type H+-transporting ATPase subunit b
MISVDSSIFIQMANFVLLIFILNAILYKPIRKILMERKKKIKGYEEGIQALHDDSAESEQTFQAKVGEAKTKGFQEKEALQQAGQEEEKRLINELAKDAEDARSRLQADTEAFSAAIVEKILGRAVP